MRLHTIPSDCLTKASGAQYLVGWTATCNVNISTLTLFFRTYVLLWFFSFFRRVISELCRPIGAKFCTMLGAAFNFIIPVQNFWELPQKIFRGQKHAKFGPIPVDFEVWRRISPERMKIFKIGELLVRQRFLLH